MLPLVELEPEHIERIVRSVPGGASNIQDIYPLAPLQEGMLFHHMMESNADTYVMVILLELESRSNLETFIDALRRVVERHDSLRSAVLWEQLPQPVQVVHRQVTLAVEEFDLDATRDSVEQLREAMRPQLQRLPLARAPLMRLEVAGDRRGGRWYALLKVHHLVCDAQSLQVMLAEIATLQGNAHRLAEPMQYRTHVVRALARARAHDAVKFFSAKLRALDEPTAPYGLLDVHGDGRGRADVRRILEPTLAQRLRVLARRHRVTPAAVFHAIWALVIARTSGRNDVVFGTVLFGRLQMAGGTQPGIGLFLNTLPLRVRLDETTAGDLLLQTQRELWELLNYEQTSLAVAQRCSGVSGSAPLFTSLLNYRHRAGDAESRRTGATAGFLEVAGQAWNNYPLSLSVYERRDEFALDVQTDTRIDPDRVAEYVVTAARSLVEALERSPQTPVAALSILPQSELRQLIGSFNATQISYPQEELIHRLFEEQVDRTPDATAVVHEGQSLTYVELDGRADQLAHHLLGRGIGTAHRVGICVERGVEMIVGVLGILKAGAAYVPLDPNYPAERLQYMLEDAAPQVVVMQESLRGRLPAMQADQVLLDSRGIAGDASKNVLPADRGQFSHDLVYVIYTSGSTGRPKGIAMPHRAMANLIQWHRSTLGSSEGCRVLQFAALSFDVAFQEIFSTLCTGGTLVLLDEWVRRDPHALTALLHDRSIDRLFLPPLMLQSLAEYCLNSTPLPRLRDIITAGEPLRITPEIVAFFRKLQCATPRDSCRLHNHYGPTETHVVTALTLEGEPGQWPTLPPIGRPIANTAIYILDAQQQPVALGVPGEIYIGGTGVAQGYLGRPQLTAERFIPDPFDDDSGSRLYKTGDLGCWQPDGILRCLGRNDDQVKVRGYRIELREIETQLERHAQVKEAVVVAREDTPGEKRLVAYLTGADSSSGASRDVEGLRAYLCTVLPDYMVPSAFIFVEKWPLTPNGKLDRRALPVPVLGGDGSSRSEAPEGEVERILAGIWCEVLQIEHVGRDDDFFDLGGHSVSGMRLIAKVAERLAIQAPVVAIFRYPTIREMADLFQKLLVHDLQSTAVYDDAEVPDGVI
jgi:amino acid adenylation domain-containing protein